jgi:quinol-cytochrome oxidoreductase complex cytochrome b subunit
VGRFGTGWSERVPISGDQIKELTNEPVPNHLKRWWFCLGGTPAYLFVVQIVTGILLAFYYQASPSGVSRLSLLVMDRCWHWRGKR